MDESTPQPTPVQPLGSGSLPIEPGPDPHASSSHGAAGDGAGQPAEAWDGHADAAGLRDRLGRFTPGNPKRWLPGQSGNPAGRRKGGVSFSAALARQAIAPIRDREEMAKIARTIGLDPQAANHIDVVAALFYVALCRALVRAATSNGRADERLVGMLQVLLRALDPAELRISGRDGGPIPIAAVIANVQTALGMHKAGGGACYLDHDAALLDLVGAETGDGDALADHGVDHLESADDVEAAVSDIEPAAEAKSAPEVEPTDPRPASTAHAAR